MHALSARPHNKVGGRGFGKCADGTTVINLILLCSHPDAHPNLNREVRRSLTWHSSKSESALERFEPVAVVMLWSDGQGTLFAPVAARRQKVFKRGKHSSFCPFRSFRTSEKNSEREVSLCLSTAAASPTPVSATPTAFASQIGQFPYLRAKVPSTVKTKDLCLSAFSFAYTGAKEKAIKKKTPKEDFALCGARPPLSVDDTAF